MGVESRRVHSDAWTQWESQVVNGVYPLRRFLGGSNHSAVFLTEYKAGTLADAAIKFVPADALQTQAQLVQWGTAATLSHPHLVRLFDVGRCRFGGRDFLFVVMEYAEQTLGQILPRRALGPDEVRDMLLPTLDALAFLHRNSLVHGQLKPANLLVVNDQLKLASDTISAAGKSATGTARVSLYDPPELKDGGISTASDVWDLGITLVEALTQRTPTWPDERAETASLPANLPAPFVEIVRRCLSRPAANRPTVMELEAMYKPAPRAPVTAAPEPDASEASPEDTPAQQSRKGSLLITVIAAMATVLVIALGVRVSFTLLQEHPNTEKLISGASLTSLQPPTSPVEPLAPVAPVPTPAATNVADGAAPSPIAAGSAAPLPTPAPESAAALPNTPSPAAPDQPSLPTTASSDDVLHEELPQITRAISERIHGHVRVTVRVLVDPSGNVVGEFMEKPGPSRYFARLAAEAAGKWLFAPTDTRGARVWLLRFEFTRGATTVDATGT
jgi:serine/threonine protein kinase